MREGFRRAARLDGLELSAIARVSERAAQMRQAGADVVSLSTGEPDFPTPDFVINAAAEAARAGQTRYTPTAGTPALREAVAQNHGREIAEVIISTGAKQVLANALLATLNPGDEVILPTPYWTSYGDIVKFCQGVGVEVACPMAAGFKLTPQALAAAITGKTRWLILNSPSNPTGAVYTAQEIAALAKVLEAHPQVWVISDEIYAHLSYVPHVSFTAAAPHLAHRTLIVNGVSKAWSMTGWRIGWGVGPAPLIKAMIAAQGQLTSGACSVSQAAALAAIAGDRELLQTRCESFRERRDLVVDGLNRLEGVSCERPDGAFYAFPAISPQRHGNAVDFCARLLEEAKVAVVPGEAFGAPEHFRLSFAYSREALTQALKRMARFV